MKGHKLNLENAKKFILGGNSIFTVVSKKTEKRYTFKVKENKEKTIYFVSYLFSGDNQYKYMGIIDANKKYKLTAKSKVNEDSAVNKTFNVVYDILMTENQKMFDKLEFWHEGKCGKCGRKLTVPSSIESGFGPICQGI